MLRGTFLILALAAAAALGCRTAPGPEVTARDYARALREGRTDDAFDLTAGAGEGKDEGRARHAFSERYASPGARSARAQEVEHALPGAQLRAGALTVVHGDNGWRVVEPADEAGPRKVLEAFLTAAGKGDFQTVWSLLAGPLRARYTPQRLEADFKAEPLAKERLVRAKAALASPPVIQGEQALFPVGDGKAVRLVLEDGSYRVAALE